VAPKLGVGTYADGKTVVLAIFWMAFLVLQKQKEMVKN
jgi:hypothetical protein